MKATLSWRQTGSWDALCFGSAEELPHSKSSPRPLLMTVNRKISCICGPTLFTFRQRYLSPFALLIWKRNAVFKWCVSNKQRSLCRLSSRKIKTCLSAGTSMTNLAVHQCWKWWRPLTLHQDISTRGKNQNLQQSNLEMLMACVAGSSTTSFFRVLRG